MKKRILSIMLALCMLVSMLPVGVLAGDGSSSNPVVVYRNPEEDEAGTDLDIGTIGDFSVRSSTVSEWISEIQSQTGVTGDVEYYIQTSPFTGYHGLNDSIALWYTYAYWFGWGAAAGGAAGVDTESRVRILKSDDTYTDDFAVKVKGYVNVNYVIEGESTPLQVPLNSTLSAAFPDMTEVAKELSEDTGYSEEDGYGITYTFKGWDANGDGYAETYMDTVVDVTGDAAAKDVDGKTFTALFDKEYAEYTVTWENYDGTQLCDPVTVEYGDTPEYTGETPVKAGNAQYSYTHSGWSPAVDEATEDITYTATFTETVNKYTVTWLNDDGSELGSTEVEYGTVPEYDGTPTKAEDAGYTYEFAGWDTTPVAVTGDASYTATYTGEPKTYGVKFNSFAGNLWETVSTEYGTAPAAPTSQPEYDGPNDGISKYTFIGWDYDEDDKADDMQVLSVDDDGNVGPLTYKAVYSTETPCVVTFMDGDSEYTSQNVVKGSTATVPTAPTKDGYRFTGWYTDKACTAAYSFDTAVEAAKLTLYAGWVEQVTVTFMDGTETLSSKTMDINSKVAKPADPTKSGYNFKGWYADKSFETEFDFTQSVTEDTKVYAKFAELVTVTFMLPGGVYETLSGVEVGATVDRPTKDPQVTNKLFDDWYADETYTTKFDFSKAIEGTTTVYGKLLDIYTVTFNKNGGSGYAMDSLTVAQGGTVNLTKNTFYKTSYRFAGWAETADATEAKYADGAAFSPKGDTTLYAVWEFVDAVDTTIELTASEVDVVFGDFTSDELLEKIGAKVMADGAEVEGAAITVEDITANDVGTYTVKLSYAGTKATPDNNVYYAAAETTATVNIAKAIGSVTVTSSAVKYPNYPTAYPVTANCETIDVIAGLDAHDETYLLATAQAKMPEEMLTLLGLALAASGEDIDLNDMSIDDLKTILKLIQDNKDQFPDMAELVDKVSAYEESLDKMVAALEKLQANLPMDSELRISIVSQLTMPTDIGVYMMASISADANYTTSRDAGYLIISPNGIQTELSWNENDDNYVITLDKLAGFDFAATAAVNESTREDAATAEAAQDHVEYLFIGADANGDLLLDRCTDANAAELELGVYAQVAYIGHWDNEMYYAVPIARPVVVAPNAAEVVIGDGSYVQTYTYDGSAKTLDITVDGQKNVDGLKYKYIGTDTTADGWYRNEAPADAGVYSVIAYYLEKDASGKLVKAGAAMTALIIEPADVEVGMEDAEYCYDGTERFAELTNTGLDYVTVAMDRANNVAYVNLPEDTAAHVSRMTAMLPASVEAKVEQFLNKFESFDGDIQTATVKTELTDVLTELRDADLTGAAVAKAETLTEKLIEELKGNEEVQNVIAKFQTQLDAIRDKIGSEIPDDIEEKLVAYIKAVISVDEDSVNLDADKIEADLRDLIAELEGQLPAVVVAEMDKMLDKVLATVDQHVDVDSVEVKVGELVDVMKEIDSDDVDKALDYVVRTAYEKIDLSELKSLAAGAAAKAEIDTYVDYVENTVNTVAETYEIDTAEVEAAIDTLVSKAEAYISSGDYDLEDVKELEPYVDAVLDKLIAAVAKIPDGTVIFGANPSEAGEYDCYAMNISANYKSQYVTGKLTVYDEHQYDEVTEEPTCEEAGKTTYTCSVCGDTYDTPIAALGHAWDNGEVTTEPTCTEDGVKTYTCQNDATHTKTEVVPATGHSYEETVTAPTCEAEGYTTYTCPCGDSYTDNEVAALGHAWDNGKVTTEPTCTEDGVKTYTCQNDATHTKTEVVPATGHSYEAVVTAPTCEAEGYTTYTCPCGDSYTDDVVSALGHDWDEGEITTEPTCTEDGVKTYTCQNDTTHTKTETVPATGHSMGDWYTVDASTCEEEGYERRDCQNDGCDHYETRGLDLAAHTPGEAVNEPGVAPACEKDGYHYSVVYCTVCGVKLSSEKVVDPATGHELVPTEAVPETCTAPGNKAYFTCSTCGNVYANAEATEPTTVEDSIIPAKGHAYTSKVTKEPTCTDTGIRTYTCAHDSTHTYTETIPAEGHDLEWVAYKGATCTADGNKQYYKCADCGKIFKDSNGNTETTLAERTIKAAHKLTKVGAVPATCTKAGNKEYYTCSACGKVYENAGATKQTTVAKMTIKATGHDWDDGVITTKPTYTKEGVMTYTCQNDKSHTYTENVKWSCEKTRETCPIGPFPDANPTSWYHDGVHFCIDEGYMQGYPNGTFQPNGDITRIEVVTVLWNIAGKPQVDCELNFSDVGTSHWYLPALRWAVKNGVVEGYPDGTFLPNKAVSRQEIAAILYRYITGNYEAPDTSALENSGLTDVSNVQNWAKGYMDWTYEQGLITGFDDNTLKPRDNTTRAQMATILYRYLTGNE